MIFSYKKFKTYNPDGYSFRPMIPIQLINGYRSIMTEALIDTGADYCIFNCGYAEPLGIEYEKGVLYKIKGISNTIENVFFHELELKIMNYEESKCIIPIGFIRSRSVGGLLGQKGFMDKFKISFERYNNKFEIMLKP